MRTLYSWFGVAEDATPEEITKQWKFLMKQCHPDLHKAVDPKRAQEVNRVYGILKDPALRRQYDAQLVHERAIRRAPVPTLQWGSMRIGTIGCTITVHFGNSVVFRF